MSQNLLLYSQVFSNSSWDALHIGDTRTDSYVTAPDNTLTGAKIDLTNVGYFYQLVTLLNVGISIGSVKTFTFSVWIYSNTKATICLRTIGVNTSSGTTNINTSLVNLTAGWVRYSIQHTSTVEDDRVYVGFDNSVASGGDGVSGTFYTWGAQLVQANWSGDYAATTGTAIGATTPPFNIVGTQQNLINYSEDFNNAFWIKKRCSITTGATANPIDGTLTADAIVETDSNLGSTTHYFYTSNFTVSSRKAYTLSWFVKPGTRTWCAIELDTGYAFFNLVGNGSYTGLVSAYNPSISLMNNGWYRISITSTTTSNSIIAYLYATNSGSSTSYTAIDGDTALYAFGAQVTLTNHVTDYTKTTSSVISSPVQNITTLDGQNIIPNSTSFGAPQGWFTSGLTSGSTSDTIDPFGGNGAYVLTENTNAITTHRIYITPVSPTALGPYTASVYVKAGIRSKIYMQSSASFSLVADLSTGTISSILGCSSTSIKDVGNSWWLITYTYTYTSPSAFGAWYLYTYTTSASYAGSIGIKAVYLYGPQITQGNHIGESYIPTTTTAVNNFAPPINKRNSVNLILASEDQSSLLWTRNTGVTGFANTSDTTDPAGGNTASKIIYDGSDVNNGSVKLNQTNSSPSGRTGARYIYGIWLKLSSGSRVFRLFDNYSQTYQSITVNTTWKFFSLVSQPSTTQLSTLVFSVYDGLGTAATPFTLYTWRAQMNKGAILSEYIKTTSSTIGPSEVVQTTNQSQ